MQKTQLPTDWKEFIELLNSNNVDYLVVGAWALAAHGRPRFSGDIDFYVRRSKDNSKKILKVLKEFGFGSLDITEEDLCRAHFVVQLGVEPCRIDIITDISGVEFDEAWAEKFASELDGLKVNFLSSKHLMINKRSAGREKDLRDAADLEAFLKKRKI
ncbi:nucleotidyltransferase [bacterium]|nr:nucleotidyltransferase [bacterium]